MESTNKQQLRNLHSRLGTLLAQKKALNSKVTSRHFELFRDAADSVSRFRFGLVAIKPDFVAAGYQRCRPTCASV